MTMNRTLRSMLSNVEPFGPARRALGWALLAFTFLAVPVLGQPVDLGGAEAVRFLIESITVEGIARAATREIVAKESRIEPGSEVDEDQLRQAIYRVRRLPFVIDADFSLQKGSERGRYVLVIRIEMASSYFLDLAGQWLDGPRDQGYLSGFDWSANLGARHFVGSGGYAFGSINRHHYLQAGYTQFHLLGPGSFLTVAATTNLEDERNNYEFSLSAGKPITASQSVRASVIVGTSDQGTGVSTSLGWLLDTTDDPVFPSEGTKVSAGVGFGTASLDRDVLGGEGRYEARARSFVLSAQHYLPLASRHSIWAELGASGIENETRIGGSPSTSDTYAFYGGALGYSWDLLRSGVGDPRNDLRFSTRALVSDGSKSVRTLSVETSLTYRRPQGSIALVFSYLDDSGRPRLAQ